LPYGDFEKLLVERGVEVDHVTVFRRVQRSTPLLADAARFARHTRPTAGSSGASRNVEPADPMAEVGLVIGVCAAEGLVEPLDVKVRTIRATWPFHAVGSAGFEPTTP